MVRQEEMLEIFFRKMGQTGTPGVATNQNRRLEAGASAPGSRVGQIRTNPEQVVQIGTDPQLQISADPQEHGGTIDLDLG